MRKISPQPLGRWPIFVLALPMLGLLLLPLVALLSASAPSDISAGMQHELFMPALWLSAQTTLISLAIIIIAGTPLGWWLAKADTKKTKLIELFVDLPIVLPPAVVGIALLHTFGREGLLGDLLTSGNIQIPFSTTAVIIAQWLSLHPSIYSRVLLLFVA